MFIAVLLQGLKYTHPHAHPSDGWKMSLFVESVPERTSQNRVNDAFFSGGIPESRPSGCDNATRKATDVYDEIVCALASKSKRDGIRQRDIEDLLIVKMGATQRSTLARHQDIMVRLGYLTRTRGSTVYSSAEYSIVVGKVRQIQAMMKMRERREHMKGAR